MYSKKQSKDFFNFLSCAQYKAVRFDEDPYFGDWRLYEVSDGEIHLPLLSLFHLLTDDILKTISFDNIAWKGMDLPSRMLYNNCVCCDGKFYKRADIDYPPILLKGTLNHYNKKYRMIDGKHRIMKMISMGLSKSSFYVLELNDIIEYLIPGVGSSAKLFCSEDEYPRKYYTILKKNADNFLM